MELRIPGGMLSKTACSFGTSTSAPLAFATA